MRAHFNRNHKELEERTLECDSCDNTCTKKDTLRMHKGVKHKAKLGNCDECEYSCTKNKVLVMHKFRNHIGQEPPRKLCELCDFPCLTTGGLRFHQNAGYSGLEGLCVLCVITQLKKITPSVNTESESMVLLIRFMKKHCYSVKSASFHLLKKAFLLSICTENMIVLSPSRIMSATYAITPSQ